MVTRAAPKPVKKTPALVTGTRTRNSESWYTSGLLTTIATLKTSTR